MSTTYNAVLFYGVRLADTLLSHNDVERAHGVELLVTYDSNGDYRPTETYVAVSSSKISDGQVFDGWFSHTEAFFKTLCSALAAAGAHASPDANAAWFVVITSY